MRLLHSRTLTFHEFFENATPPYAILSHTWEQEEVTYQDMKGPEAQKLAGYIKIQHCCKLAALEELDFVWIDTCCIDKTSSAELSEAINSMYQWYKNSEICFAYLVDVPPDTPFDVSAPTSRWFTRGWTLQELIAPVVLDFYSQDWKRMGRKEDLSDVVSKITGIDHATLGGKSVMEVSVAKRMSWASARITSRPEDIAYCLIGIFGVNLPLLYGEGDRAFVRLQEEIMKGSDDQSLFGWGFRFEPKMTKNALQGGVRIYLHTPCEGVDPIPVGESSLNAHPRSLSGFLARSPADFRNSGNILPYRNWDLSMPYSMTNQGLQIQLSILQLENSNDYIGVLACHFEDNYLGPLGIYIQPVASPGADQFARDSSYPNPVIVVPEHVSKAIPRTVYIRQNVILPTARDSDRKHHFLIRTLPPDEYNILHHYPKENWNASQKIMRSPDRLGALMFRYQGGQFERAPLPFAIIFRAKVPTDGREEETSYSCSIVVDPLIASSEGLEEIVQDTAADNFQSKDADLTPWSSENKERGFAKISREVYMGQEMFVVDIAVLSIRLKMLEL
jgi:hypothetical protein